LVLSHTGKLKSSGIVSFEKGMEHFMTESLSTIAFVNVRFGILKLHRNYSPSKTSLVS
jgi:hypothetical protein